eukprot:ANDGO_04570.mRNA.1 hypothetical protein H257_01147
MSKTQRSLTSFFSGRPSNKKDALPVLHSSSVADQNKPSIERLSSSQTSSFGDQAVAPEEAPRVEDVEESAASLYDEKSQALPELEAHPVVASEIPPTQEVVPVLQSVPMSPEGASVQSAKPEPQTPAAAPAHIMSASDSQTANGTPIASKVELEAEISKLCSTIQSLLKFEQTNMMLWNVPIVPELIKSFSEADFDASACIPEDWNRLFGYLIQEQECELDELVAMIFALLKDETKGAAGRTVTPESIRSKILIVGKREVYGCAIRSGGVWEVKSHYAIMVMETLIASIYPAGVPDSLWEHNRWEVSPAVSKLIAKNIQTSLTSRKAERKSHKAAVSTVLRDLKAADRKYLKVVEQENKVAERLEKERRERERKEKEKEVHETALPKIRTLAAFGFSMTVGSRKEHLEGDADAARNAETSKKSVIPALYLDSFTKLAPAVRVSRKLSDDWLQAAQVDDLSPLVAEFRRRQWYSKQLPRRPKRDEQKIDEFLALVDGDIVPVQEKFKFLKFEESLRPPYFGTYRKTSKVINGRRPFAQDASLFDYEVESDLDWEEENVEDAESIGSDGGDKDDADSEDNEYYEDEFCVADDDTFSDADPTGFADLDEVDCDDINLDDLVSCDKEKKKRKRELVDEDEDEPIEEPEKKAPKIEEGQAANFVNVPTKAVTLESRKTGSQRQMAPVYTKNLSWETVVHSEPCKFRDPLCRLAGHSMHALTTRRFIPFDTEYFTGPATPVKKVRQPKSKKMVPDTPEALREPLISIPCSDQFSPLPTKQPRSALAEISVNSAVAFSIQ